MIPIRDVESGATKVDGVARLRRFRIYESILRDGTLTTIQLLLFYGIFVNEE